MDDEQWNEWRARRGDEPGAFGQVRLYVVDVYPAGDWRAREVEFIEDVEAKAEEVYEEQGAPGLKGERDLIDHNVDKQQGKYQRMLLDQNGFELIAGEIRRRYSDFEGRVIDDLEVVPRDAFGHTPDNDVPRAPNGSLVLRPDGDAYRLEPTARLLESREMTTEVRTRYSFEVLQVADGDTWEEITQMVKEQIELWKESTQEAHRELKFLRARREVYDALLERRAKGRDMPWEQTATSTMPKDGTDFVGSPDAWEVNCARMYAYLQEHQMPNRLRPDLDEAIERNTPLDSFSFSHAWRELRKEGYDPPGEGTDALPVALEEWAQDFQDEYGWAQAVAAADPLEWPLDRAE